MSYCYILKLCGNSWYYIMVTVIIISTVRFITSEYKYICNCDINIIVILIFREIYFSLTLSTQQNKLCNFIRTEYTYELSFYFVKYLKHAIFRLKTMYNSYVYLEDHGGHVILVSDISTFLVITYTSNSIFRSSFF